MIRYLVTGGAGFIGSHIVNALCRRGDYVRVIDDFSTGSIDNLYGVIDDIDLICGDITDEKIVNQGMKNIDIVYHQAALPSVLRSIEDPMATHNACATGTINLLNAAVKAGVSRLIYAASSSAYGDCDQVSKKESFPNNPLSPYAAAKLSGELYCKAFSASMGLTTVALRYFNVFGPRQDPNSPYSAVIPLFISAIAKGNHPVIYGDGLQSRDFTYIDNVIHANLLAASAPENRVNARVFNVGQGGSISLIELLKYICEEMQTEVQATYEKPREGDVRHSCANLSLSKSLLGYKPKIDFRSGLSNTIQFYSNKYKVCLS